MKSTVLIISGDGDAARAAANIYSEKLGDKYNIKIIEEQNITFSKGFEFIRKRLKKRGLINTVNFIFLRIALMIINNSIKIQKRYSPDLKVENINSQYIVNYIKDNKPDFVITNACSILKQETIEAISAPIINVHNGINPRYRGIGNVWAFYENNPHMVGATVHYVDKGIDTGKIISVKEIDFSNYPVQFRYIDIEAFKQGAEIVVDYILFRKNKVPDKFKHLLSRCYTYPGFTTYLKARKNYYRFLQNNVEMESIWKKSFGSLSNDQNKNNLQKMHWQDFKTVPKRDNLINQIYNRCKGKKKIILDVGCGNGRYSEILDRKFYIGCDYSYEIMSMEKELIIDRDINENIKGFLNIDTQNNVYISDYPDSALIECDARKLPLIDNCIDVSLSIGLLQHIQDMQQVVDELIRVTKTNGYIIINTLRQFSFLELIIIWIVSIIDKNQFKLATSIFLKNYYSGQKINGRLVARRYSAREIIKATNYPKKNIKVYYNGIFNTRLFSKEVTFLIENDN